MIDRIIGRFTLPFRWLSLAAVAMGLAGCHFGSSPDATKSFGPATKADSSLKAAEAYVSKAGESAFSVVGAEDGSKGKVTVSIEPVSGGHRWQVRYVRDSAKTPFREDVLESTDAGVVMIETTEYDRDALTVYDPPLTLMPRTLEPGKIFKQEIKMVIHPPSDRNKVRRRGTGHQTVELIGKQSVKTGAGEVDAFHVRSHFVAELSPAHVEIATERWYAHEKSTVGFVAERYDEKLTILGVESSARGYLWILRANH